VRLCYRLPKRQLRDIAYTNVTITVTVSARRILQHSAQQNKLDGRGRARPEAARRRKSECKLNSGRRNSSRKSLQTDRQTDGQTDDGCRAIALAHYWNELICINSLLEWANNRWKMRNPSSVQTVGPTAPIPPMGSCRPANREKENKESQINRYKHTHKRQIGPTHTTRKAVGDLNLRQARRCSAARPQRVTWRHR